MSIRLQPSTPNPIPAFSPTPPSAATGPASALPVSSGDAGPPASDAPDEASALAPANKSLLETLGEGFSEAGEKLADGVRKLADGDIIDGLRDVVTGLLQGTVQVVSALSAVLGFLKMPALDLLKGRS